jgi:hypothetical protein
MGKAGWQPASLRHQSGAISFILLSATQIGVIDASKNRWNS